MPSGAWVTVFSFDLTVPSLLTLLLLVWEISWAHPINRNDSVMADIATQITALGFVIVCFIGKKIRDGWILTMGGLPR